MGWLFMSRGGMSPFATPKAYLDNQCTYPPDPDKGVSGTQTDHPRHGWSENRGIAGGRLLHGW
jgi:hypothetical protein